MGLKNLFEKMEPAFLPGGKYSKLYPVFESIYTLLYTPGTVTHKNTHVRDALDSKRMMITVFLALFLSLIHIWPLFLILQEPQHHYQSANHKQLKRLLPQLSRSF